MIVKGCVIFERTLLSRKKSHNFAWSCAISNIFYYAGAVKQPNKNDEKISIVSISVHALHYQFSHL